MLLPAMAIRGNPGEDKVDDPAIPVPSPLGVWCIWATGCVYHIRCKCAAAVWPLHLGFDPLGLVVYWGEGILQVIRIAKYRFPATGFPDNSGSTQIGFGDIQSDGYLLGCWAVGLFGCLAVGLGLWGCLAVGLWGCWAVGCGRSTVDCLPSTVDRRAGEYPGRGSNPHDLAVKGF